MLTITLRAADYEAVFAPQNGGACIQLKKGDREIFHHISDEKTVEEKATRFGLPFLFPPNRLDGGTYQYEDSVIAYPVTDLERNVNCHGPLHKRPWQVEGYTEDDDYAEIHMVFQADEDSDLYEQYPFEYEIEQIYTLDAQGLHQEVRVTNFSEKKMPYGLGWHTAFAINKEHNPKISVSIDKKVELSERILPTGNLLALNENEQKIASAEGGDPLCSVLDDHFTSSPLTLDGKEFHGAVITDPVEGTRVFYRVDPFYKHWMIWNSGQEGSFVCIEPQNWRINAPNLPIPAEESGLNVLESQETISITADVWME